jgi:hypothetical protein
MRVNEALETVLKYCGGGVMELYGEKVSCNINWDGFEDGTTIIEVAVENDEQADRCASALRRCGATIIGWEEEEEEACILG